MTCWSYGVFLAFESASFRWVTASSYFWACSASCAAFSGLARSLLTLFSSFFSAATTVEVGTRPATLVTATPRMSAATTLAREELQFTFMGFFRIAVGLRSLGLLTELGGVDEADLLHAVS